MCYATLLTNFLSFLPQGKNHFLLIWDQFALNNEPLSSFFFFDFCFSHSYFFLPKKPRSLDTCLCGLLVIKTKKVGRGEEQSRGLSIHCTLKCEFCCILVIQSKTGENVSRRKPNHVRLTKNVLRFTFKGSEYFRGSSRSLKRAVHTSKTTAYCQFSL